MEDLMVRCLVLTAHASKRAHEQLTAEGFELDPPMWEDVRATGTSLFIERNKQAGAR